MRDWLRWREFRRRRVGELGPVWAERADWVDCEKEGPEGGVLGRGGEEDDEAGTSSALPERESERRTRDDLPSSTRSGQDEG